MTTAGWPGSAARSARAEASGSSGSRISESGSAALDASTPALAHTKPWRVRQISRPASARTSSAASDSTPRRGAGPCRARRPARCARSPGRHVGEPHDPALGLGDDLVRDRDDVGRRAARRRRASSAARSSPGRISGSPGSASSSSNRRRPRAARACARRRRARAERAAQRREVVGRVDVELSERASATCERRARRARASRRWRANEPSPNAGAMTSGGVSRSAFVPVPWRSGTITTSASDAPSSALTSRRVQRRAVAGDEQRRARRRARARPRCRARRPRTGRPRPGRGRSRAPVVARSAALRR